MRVIAGEARGRTLRAPHGLRTRPTSDLLRGAIFSMLDSMGCKPLRVLDLYAGSGALGIEALSRGAQCADFVERGTAACAIIRTNLERTGFAGRGRVFCLPVVRSLERLTGPYDLIFLDPPYVDRSVEEVLALPSAVLLLGKDSFLVYEHSRRDAPPQQLGIMTLLRTRSHGSSSVSFYFHTAESAGKGRARD
ncbi:MAG TPA: 16S rRNA (guanine(966)-N(2))-methyltransferase RsmD [Dehalococcoidia bacterium]|nr:16S rRNA (guanine(966)-N(2))-methyltransferase RsmD [Dehalococcoidia bacterium]